MIACGAGSTEPVFDRALPVHVVDDPTEECIDRNHGHDHWGKIYNRFHHQHSQFRISELAHLNKCGNDLLINLAAIWAESKNNPLADENLLTFGKDERKDELHAA